MTKQLSLVHLGNTLNAAGEISEKLEAFLSAPDFFQLYFQEKHILISTGEENGYECTVHRP